MKNLFLFCLLVSVACQAQLPPPPATVAEVEAGTDTYKYVTPYTLAQSGGGGGGGGGVTVSNYMIQFTTDQRYTNTTEYPVFVSAIIDLIYVGSGVAVNHLNVDTNLDGVTDWQKLVSYDDVGGASVTSQVELSIMVPTNAAWEFADDSSGGSSAAVNTVTPVGGQLTYFIGGGGGEGSVDFGAFLFTSTNTLNVGSSNAITVVSNATSWASIAFSGADAVSRGFNLTFYPTANSLVYTSGASAGFYFVGSVGGIVAVTNATYPDVAGDRSDTAGTAQGSNFPTVDDGGWIDNESDFNPITVISTEGALTYSASHARFHGEFPSPSGMLTNNWQAGAGEIALTNKVVSTGLRNTGSGWDLRVDYALPFSQPFMLLTNGLFRFSGGSVPFEFVWGPSAESYIAWGNGSTSYGFLLRSKIGVGLECPSDNGVIRLTDDHRTDGLVKLAGQLAGSDTSRYETNNFSGMLGFQPFGGTDGAPLTGMAGMRAKNPAGATIYNVGGIDYKHSELWLYTLIPPQLSNSLGGFRNVGDTNWFGIGRTNAFYVKGLTIVSNTLSSWPSAPINPGDANFVNSNGVVYILTSGVGATWTGTNKLAP